MSLKTWVPSVITDALESTHRHRQFVVLHVVAISTSFLCRFCSRERRANGHKKLYSSTPGGCWKIKVCPPACAYRRLSAGQFRSNVQAGLEHYISRTCTLHADLQCPLQLYYCAYTSATEYKRVRMKSR